MHLFALECIVACCFEKRDKKTRQKRDKNETKNGANKKFQIKNEAKPCQKKQALLKDFDKIAPSRQIIIRGGISQREKSRNSSNNNIPKLTEHPKSKLSRRQQRNKNKK